VNQFESKQQPRALTPSPHTPAKEVTEPLVAKASKLSLNNPPVRLAPEKATDPIVLGKPGAAARPAANPERPNDVQLSQEFLDVVTLNVRAVLSGHPVAQRPQEASRLAEDRVKVEATKSNRKNAEQNLRVQQTTDIDRAQQKTVSQQQSAGHGPEHASREKQDTKAQKTQTAGPTVKTEIPGSENQRTLEDARRAQAVQVKQLAEKKDSSQQNALAERNASRDGERASLSQDLVRGRSDSNVGQIPKESEQRLAADTKKAEPAQLPEQRASQEQRVPEQKLEQRPEQKVEQLRTLSEKPIEELKREREGARAAAEDRAVSAKIDAAELKADSQQQLTPVSETWQTVSLKDAPQRNQQNATDQIVVQQKQNQVQQAEEEEERREREERTRKRKTRSQMKKRVAQKVKRALKKKTPGERWKEKLRRERDRRLRWRYRRRSNKSDDTVA